MKDRPILMSAPMVRAILDGRKTQTRRVVKAPLEECHVKTACSYNALIRGSPYGHPGDQIRVKESSWIWCEKRRDGFTKTGRKKWRFIPVGQHVVYCSDHGKPVGKIDGDPSHGWRFKAGRFMPKWASRITLEITAVRVERLQEITEKDAKAEGIEGRWHPDDPDCWTWKDYRWSDRLKEPSFCYGSSVTPISTYEGLWESINGKGSWALNPWVWVVSFKRIKL